MNQLTILLGYLELSHDMLRMTLRVHCKGRRRGRDDPPAGRIHQGLPDVGVNMPVWVDLPVVIRETASIIDHPGMKVDVGINPGLRVFADPLIRKIISNVIENTVLHGKTANTITITASEQPGGLVIAFCDNGAGVPAEARSGSSPAVLAVNEAMDCTSREILALTGMAIARDRRTREGSKV